MPDNNATTMELPVPVVRMVARLAFNYQRECIETDVVAEARKMNEHIALANQGFFRRHGICKQEPLFDLTTIYASWKELYLNCKMSDYHPAYFIFRRNQTWWWKRLMQFCELPEADDNKTIRMSMEDLKLIDYTHYLSEAQERLAAKKEQA